MEKQNAKCLTDSKTQETKYKRKNKKTCRSTNLPGKTQMFDRSKTWNVLKKANKKCANTKYLTDGETKIADKNTKCLTDSILQKHKNTLKMENH